MECVFCKIIAGEIPSYKIYEDEKSCAFLDINPVTKGHTLLIPKEHFQMMVDTPDELISHLYIRAKTLMKIIKKGMNADYVSISVVGVDVPHFHIHLIPRNFNDGLADFWPTKKYKTGEAEKILKKLLS
jgi:histidine triad (HIT) family protein